MARIDLDGAVTSAPHEVSAEFAVLGRDIHLNPLAQYLRNAGCEPVATDGPLKFDANVFGTIDDHSIVRSAAISVDYRGGDTPLVSLKSARIAGLRLESGRVSADSIRIRSPWASVTRNADGRIEMAGIRLIAKPSPKTDQADFQASASPVDPAPTMTAAAKSLDIQDAELSWVDRTVVPAVSTVATMNASLKDFNTTPASPTSPLHLDMKVAGSLESLAADGTLSVSPDQQALRMDVVAEGIRGGPLASYLPPNIHPTLLDGRLRAGISAAVAANPHGGTAVELNVTDLDYRDGSRKCPI